MEDNMALTDKELQEKEVQTSDSQIQDDIIDVEIKPIKRKRFRLNGDNNKIIELNTSDLNISVRLEKGWEELQKLANSVANVDTDEEDFSTLLQEYDKKMRDELDYIFDAKVADKASDGGTMYDPYGGVLRYEHILDTLLSLYTTNINKEFSAIKRRVSKHTDKYTVPKKSSTTRRTTKK